MSDKEKQEAAELAKAQRADDEEGDGEEENDEGEEEEEKAEDGCGNTAKGGPVSPCPQPTTKSEDLTEDDLEKSLASLEDFVESKDVPTRKQALLKKAQETQLSKSESEELSVILGVGEKAPDTALADKVEKAMEPSEDLQKALDVSDFLNETHEEAKRINTMLASQLEKSDARQQEFNLMLAKGVADIGNLVKSVNERLGSLESQPAHRPKSQSRPLEKSFANTKPNTAEQGLSKSDILNTMSSMIEKSCDAGQAGVVDGVDLIAASAGYEQMGTLSKRVIAMVQKEKGFVH